MSRAFVKEIDDAPPPPPLERPVSFAPNLVTVRGARLIETEVERLSAEFEAASDAEGELLQPDLRYWENRRATMQIVERDPAETSVGFGSEVVIARNGSRQTLRIVGEDEADPKSGYLAWTSPLARVLEGGEAGEVVEFQAGNRTDEIEILGVRPI